MLLLNPTKTLRYYWETSADYYYASVENNQDFKILLGNFCRSLQCFCGKYPRLQDIVGKLLQMITKFLWNLTKTLIYCWETSADHYHTSVESSQDFKILLGNFCR